MTPELVDSDPERFAALDAVRGNVRFFSKHVDALKQEHGGRYIVVHEQDVAVAAERPEEAWRTVEERGIEADECVMHYVPKAGRAFFY